LPDPDPVPESTWKLWLDFWAQAARNPDVANVRQEFDVRWREMVVSLVTAGQTAGEFADIDPHPFSIFLCALLDGLAIQIALDDPVVDPVNAYELCMLYIADRLGFQWTPSDRERLAAVGGRAAAQM
ncbi:MAG: TetR family transcriptional regulator C-terminal domain-containing protein, partial [Streptosporangiaceae bacterium]